VARWSRPLYCLNLGRKFFESKFGRLSLTFLGQVLSYKLERNFSSGWSKIVHNHILILDKGDCLNVTVLDETYAKTIEIVHNHIVFKAKNGDRVFLFKIES